MKCEYCDNEVPPGSARCPSCGAAVKVEPVPQAPVAPAVPAGGMYVPQAPVAPAVPAGGVYVAAQPAMNVVLNVPPKSRVTYVLLAVFLGWMGVHNFYAGYTGRGVAQLLITSILGTITCGLASIPIELWAIIEACVINTDSRGVPFT